MDAVDFLPQQVVRPCMASSIRSNHSDQLVTPDIARTWLDHWNTRNRRFKGGSSDLYAREMKQGNWKRGSRIIFYGDGVLCDGQNRLLAVVKSKIPCLFDVLIGASIDEGTAIDTGTKRSVQDALQIKGCPEWIANKNTVALVNTIHKLATSSNGYKLSHSVIEEFASANEPWLRPAIEIGFYNKKLKLTSAGYCAQIAVALRHGESYEELKDFHSRYVSGENYEAEKNSTIRLREYILSFHGTPWTLPTGYDTAKRTQRAIQAFIQRQHLHKLYAPAEYIYQFPTVLDI
jgi:hypothetical protein